MKTAISLPDDVYTSAESLAERLGVSRSKLYARAVDAYVQQHQNAQITVAFNRVYTAEGSRLDKRFAALQEASLPKEVW
jgi:metal-responsive CopG/Arc/MetJ family transcriptional regulator